MTTVRDINSAVLGKRNRVIWRMIFKEHKTVKEVAVKFGLNKYSVYTAIRRMRLAGKV